MLLGLYRGATLLGGPLIEAQLRRRALRGKEDRLRWRERLGVASLGRPAGPLVWLHAASLGESRSLLPLIEVLLAERSALELLITTGTVTSAALMAEALPPRTRHQFAPVDRPQAWRAFLGHWRPALGLLVESELWPNLILEARGRQIPLALINGRMSARSYRRWSHVTASAAQLLAGFEIYLAQSDIDRDRLAALGARHAVAVGNLKLAAPPLPADPASLAALSAAFAQRPVWLAASSHPGEEAVLLETHRRLVARFPRLLTVIAPRHPARGEALAAQGRSLGLGVAQRSSGALADNRCGIYVADTLGELGLFYRLASAALIGGSLVPHGGHNPLEPARLGCPIVLGPHDWNFAAIGARLVQAGAALRIDEAGALCGALTTLLSDRALRERMATAATTLAQEASRAGLETCARLAPLLARTLGPADAGA